MDHMCINSCVAYTGLFKALEVCPVCDEPRFNAGNCPRQVIHTIPIEPQLQALRRNKDKAMTLRYRTLHTEALILELADNDGLPKGYSGFFDGSQYMDTFEHGLIKEDDIVLMLSLNSTQLFASKHSDCLMCIWVVFDHSPDVCYKKPYVLPAFTIPGPNPPQVMDSFLHISEFATPSGASEG